MIVVINYFKLVILINVFIFKIYLLRWVYLWDKWINVEISKSIVILIFLRLKVFFKGKIKIKMEIFKFNYFVDVLIKFKFGI